jgi:hypothetical protein
MSHMTQLKRPKLPAARLSVRLKGGFSEGIYIPYATAAAIHKRK